MAKSPEPKSGRAYRSHLQPACLACRRRKSRCAIDEGQDGKCSLCLVHGSECIFPSSSNRREDSASPHAAGPSPRAQKQLSQGRKRKRQDVTPGWAEMPYSSIPRSEIPSSNSQPKNLQSAQSHEGLVGTHPSDQSSTALRLHGETDHHSSHIIGPMAANDAEVVEDYLSILPPSHGQKVRPTPYSMSSKGPGGPVLYMTVQKIRVGIIKDTSPGFDKSRIVEKMVEPFSEELINLFFEKINTCFPLLDETAFRKQFTEDKKSIPPSVIAILYASSLIFWKTSPKLSNHHCPDIRYVWIQASDALIEDLDQAPGISSIIIGLLDVGGRPTTSMTGNAMLIGQVLALAHSLGLNRNPLAWPLPQRETSLRVRVWWAIVIHDRWCSFAYGTPPQINRAHCDVPVPTIEQCSSGPFSSQKHAAAGIFIALCNLTAVLGACLEHVYDLHGENESASTGTHPSVPQLELQLDTWEENLSPRVRDSVIRGIQSADPGLPNLRLAYLAVRLLIRRLDMDSAKRRIPEQIPTIAHKRNQAQRAAEDIVFLVQSLQEPEIKGFWLPTSAFILASAATFLVRCALENSSSFSSSPSSPSPSGISTPLGQNRSLALVQDLLHTLRSYRDIYGWEIGDICLAQCNDIVERLQTTTGPPQPSPSVFGTRRNDGNATTTSSTTNNNAPPPPPTTTPHDQTLHHPHPLIPNTTAATALPPQSDDWLASASFDMSLPDDLFPSLWDVFNSEALN